MKYLDEWTQASTRLLGALMETPDEAWRMAPVLDRGAVAHGICRDAYSWLLKRGERRLGTAVEPEELREGLEEARYTHDAAAEFVLYKVAVESASARFMRARAQDVHRLFYGRQFIDAMREATHAAEAAYEQGEPYEAVRQAAMRKLSRDTHAGSATSLIPVWDANAAALRSMQQASERDGHSGFSWGLDTLDRGLGGLKPGQLSVVGARMKVGKTHAAVHLAERVASNVWPHLGNARGSVLYFSLEMSEDEVRQRALAWLTGINASEIGSGLLSREGWAAVNAAITKSDGFDMYYNTDRGLTIEALADVCRARAMDTSLDLIVVDYLDLVRRPQSKRDDLELGRIVRGLLEVAGELKAHVLLLAQLNREGVGKPHVSHLAGSDEIARAAHHIVLIEREEMSMSRSEREMAGLNGKPTSSKRKVQLHVTTRGRGVDGPIEANLDLATSRLSISSFESEEVPL